MKLLISLVSLFAMFSATGQNLYKAENGKARFFSEALIEDIEATTTNAIAAMNDSTGDVAVRIPIKSFVFDKSLMREHFNENYMESEKYPDATFKGKIEEKVSLTAGESKVVNVKGNLLIHGVSQPRNIQVNLKTNTDNTVTATGKFNVTVADHKIKIPSIVFQNIAEVVEVTCEFILKPAAKP
jgi:polyisoprenoid-binding protein YceI